jgi:hypothetical protein
MRKRFAFVAGNDGIAFHRVLCPSRVVDASQPFSNDGGLQQAISVGRAERFVTIPPE